GVEVRVFSTAPSEKEISAFSTRQCSQTAGTSAARHGGTIVLSPRLVGVSVGRVTQRKVTHEKVSYCTWTEFVARYCGRNNDGAHGSRRSNDRNNLCGLQSRWRLLARSQNVCLRRRPTDHLLQFRLVCRPPTRYALSL